MKKFRSSNTEVTAEKEFFEEPSVEVRTSDEDVENKEAKEIPWADESEIAADDTSHFVRRSTRVSKTPFRLLILILL